MQAPTSELPDIAAGILARLRTEAPRVHCITNTLAQGITANTLLAVGAVPSMTIAPEEVGLFVKGAEALLVNLGTLDAERKAAIAVAIEATVEQGRNWVLDPVLINRSEPRASFARELVARMPKAIRLNRAEYLTLTGVHADEASLANYASGQRTVLGLTGPIDFVADGARLVAITNGHPLMAKVTALGCAESALVAACLAIESDAWLATAAALLIMGVAGEIAAERARGPGSFAAEILDALFALDRDTLIKHARVN